MSVKWYGDDLLKAIRDNLDDALFEGAKVIQKAAIAKAPQGATGKLKRGIYAASASKNNYKKIGKTDRRIKPAKGTAVVASGTWYGRMVEYGTAHSAAKPFLRPALDEMRYKAAETIVNHLRAKILGSGGGLFRGFKDNTIKSIVKSELG